jgi:hypothetical protein
MVGQFNLDKQQVICPDFLRYWSKTPVAIAVNCAAAFVQRFAGIVLELEFYFSALAHKRSADLESCIAIGPSPADSPHAVDELRGKHDDMFLVYIKVKIALPRLRFDFYGRNVLCHDIFFWLKKFNLLNYNVCIYMCLSGVGNTSQNSRNFSGNRQKLIAIFCRFLTIHK